MSTKVMERKLFYQKPDGDIQRKTVAFKVPHGWQGAMVEQLLASSRAVQATSRPGDGRWVAAEWIVINLGKTK